MAPPPQVVTVRNAQKVAAALANGKCRRILEHLQAHEDATETGIAKALAIPLSTVHYNMKVLVEAKLVLDDRYSYSSRGRDVTHYRANPAPVVIVQDDGAARTLGTIVPAAILAAGTGLAYWFATRVQPDATSLAAPAAAPMLKATALSAQAIPVTTQPTADFLPAFLVGVVATVVLSALVALAMRAWRARVQR